MCDTHSEQINELAKALAAAQGELEPAEKNSTAAVGKEGKLKRKYADLTAMIDAVRKVLPKHGLSIAQIVLPSEGGCARQDDADARVGAMAGIGMQDAIRQYRLQERHPINGKRHHLRPALFPFGVGRRGGRRR